MREDMSEIELITWMELRFGITKTVGSNPSNDQFVMVENQLTSLLQKYKKELQITIPIPRIRMWLSQGKLNFMFFDKQSNKRILLGHWLSNKEKYYEQ